MRPVTALLALGPIMVGCGDAAGGLPDAGPDLLSGNDGSSDVCGPWAAYVVGRTRQWVGRFGGGGQFETTTVVDSFDGDGLITETVMSGDPEDDFHGEGTNHFRCDEGGLRTVDTEFEYLGLDGQVYYYESREYDPPMLRVRRNLALGDTWSESSTVTQYSSFGNSVDDLNVDYQVAAEQLVVTAAGAWNALLVEGTNDAGDIAERDWRAPGVGAVMFATFDNGVPGFAQELTALEDR